MSKQSSEVAFIPDNISNISSQKQRYNQDTSHKIEESYISKLTKFQNDKIDAAQIIQNRQNKNSLQLNKNTSNKYQGLNAETYSHHKDKLISKNSNKKIAFISEPTTKNTSQKKLIIHRFTRQVQDPYNSNNGIALQKKQPYFQNDNTYIYGRRTQTDVISQKQSFIEEEEDNFINQNVNKRKINQLVFDRQDKKNSSHKKGTKVPDASTQQEIMHITQIDKYDEVETQLGWLQHCIDSNHKFLYLQTNDLVKYTNGAILEIQKVQLRAKIIQLQLETNKLKIALRKTKSTKHINFSLDLKFNRPTYLKIPKKIDLDLRAYCEQLQKAVNKLKKNEQQNRKQLSLLQFYHAQFSKKVNFAYIYQQYLIQKGNRQLGKQFIKQISRQKDQNMHQSNDSKYKTSKGKSNNEIRGIGKQKQSDQSITSIGKRMNQISKTPVKKSYGIDSTRIMTSPKKRNYHNSYDEQNIRFDDYQSPNQQLKNIKLPLTHHKQLTHPSRNKFVKFSSSSQNLQGQSQKLFFPLFNTSNRQKKHFYYECQLYLKQLQHDYLFTCQQQKQNALKNDQIGFRKRQFLKMKALNVKNQILDTEVDNIQKQKELKKQNFILKRQLQLLQQRIQTQFGNINHFDINSKKINKMNLTNQRSNGKYRLKSPDYRKSLYTQTEIKLNKIKSATIFQKLSHNQVQNCQKVIQSPVKVYKANNRTDLQAAKKSPLKFFVSQSKLKGYIFGNATQIGQTAKNNLHSRSSEKFFSTNKVGKVDKFVNRFKKISSETFLKQTHKQKLNSQKAVDEKPIQLQKIDIVHIQDIKQNSRLVENQYYSTKN